MVFPQNPGKDWVVGEEFLRDFHGVEKAPQQKPSPQDPELALET